MRGKLIYTYPSGSLGPRICLAIGLPLPIASMTTLELSVPVHPPSSPSPPEDEDLTKFTSAISSYTLMLLMAASSSIIPPKERNFSFTCGGWALFGTLISLYKLTTHYRILLTICINTSGLTPMFSTEVYRV